jgi:pimeloyl-ACP methyl ester carboxylesterase
VTEQSRARYPDDEGFVERDGVRVFWERYGEGETTILFLPAWSVVHSRLWKGQIPYFARHYRVLAFDPRGNGRSDQPADPAAYADVETVGDALAVMDATATERVIVVGVSMGGWTGALLAGLHPERVSGAVLIGPVCPLGDPLPERTDQAFTEEVDTEEGWRGKFNQHYWRRDFPGFAAFFARKIASDPHSTKQVEDAEGWILQTTPESLIASAMSPGWKGDVVELYEGIVCPTLVMHGSEDQVQSYSNGVALAEAIGVPLVTLDGMGHAPEARYPVKTNILIREFVEAVRAGTAEAPMKAATRA